MKQFAHGGEILVNTIFFHPGFLGFLSSRDLLYTYIWATKIKKKLKRLLVELQKNQSHPGNISN